MLGSQLIDTNPRISGFDLGVPEVRWFGFCRFRDAVRTNDSWDSHTGPEVVFVMEGEACWEVGEHDLVQANGGQAVVFPAGARHRILNSIYPPSESLWILMKGPDEVEAPSLLMKDAHAEFCGLLNTGRLLRDINESCKIQITELARLLADPAVFGGGRLIVSDLRAKLHNVMLEFWKTCGTRGERAESNRIVAKAKTFLNANSSEEVSIGELAERLGCSRGHLHAVFRSEMGMSPIDYLRRLRITKSCASLTRSVEPITEIALSNGFESSQYFARVFRRYVGISPREFREKYQQR
jgi:AraC-like DNA-binding protein